MVDVVRLTEIFRQDAEAFYRMAFAEALAVHSAQFHYQLRNERDWEQARRPYYNLWPSIVPMLTRLNLDLDSSLVTSRCPPCASGCRSSTTR